MLSHFVRVLNFDDSLLHQQQLLKKYQPTVVDLKDIGPFCRLYLNDKNSDDIRSRLDSNFKNAVTFLGSGDFHHISGLLVEQFTQPITVIIFDFHPDWDILPPKLGYGSWITYILNRPNVRKIILLGVSSKDISTFSLQTGNLKALDNDRVEIYPYTHRPTTTMFKKLPDESLSVRMEQNIFYTKIYWRQLKDVSLTDFFKDLLTRIETKQVYVSVDKDCLKSQYALTNWEEGFLDLKDVLLLLDLIKKDLDIVGLDIIGDYSPTKVAGIIKSFLYHSDHPRQFPAKDKTFNEISAVNEETNLKILDLIRS